MRQQSSHEVELLHCAASQKEEIQCNLHLHCTCNALEMRQRCSHDLDHTAAAALRCLTRRGNSIQLQYFNGSTIAMQCNESGVQ